MSEEAKDAILVIFGFIIAICIFILVLGFTITHFSIKKESQIIDENDKCYIEVEGNENREYAYYELHPMEDCEE